ncbi:hypothetical protein FOC1_g10005672 [Fusarium oxysporum f. sp. cubense race 1]|uniref:Uncharacterized protein n=1 Tax=Fusarium oxysporum f. sp. cubense (strain race 1) TaxID=1229664 RepID=N4TMV0_FUSC1|nr:hypothetical protein FOC1_g10005672 [Fusarium oxysporum f. sp. cubense race 1]
MIVGHPQNQDDSCESCTVPTVRLESPSGKQRAGNGYHHLMP